MENDLQYDLDDLTGQSPEMVANSIFSKEPEQPCKYRIVSDPGDQNADLTYIFEILITIFMEGFDVLVDGLPNVDIDNLTEEHITSLKPWFHSIGFNIFVNTYDLNDEYAKDLYKDYYCKIMVRTPLYETFFAMKNVNKNYHFLLNGPFLEKNRDKKFLKDITGVFLTSSKAFKITFDFFKS